MEPFTRDPDNPMGSSDQVKDMPPRFRRWWANLKKKTRRTRRRKDREVIKNMDWELWDADPKCDHEVVDAPGGGVKCNKCKGWFCY
jgi:hypothetical protein